MALTCLYFIGEFANGCWAFCGTVLQSWVGSWLDAGTLWPPTQLAIGQATRASRTDRQDGLQLPAKTCQEPTVSMHTHSLYNPT